MITVVCRCHVPAVPTRSHFRNRDPQRYHKRLSGGTLALPINPLRYTFFYSICGNLGIKGRATVDPAPALYSGGGRYRARYCKLVEALEHVSLGGISLEVYDCLRSRLTVRSFKADPVPDAVVTKIVQAAWWAPSSRNQQPWHFIVIRDAGTLKRMGEIATSGRFIAGAPMAIAIVMDGADRPELDAGRALQQMELMAWAEGLGTCFVGLRVAEQNRQIKELLRIPAEMDLITVMPFGYRDDHMKGTRRCRKPISEIVHSERFGEEY